jgi:hypothetical protein
MKIGPAMRNGAHKVTVRLKEPCRLIAVYFDLSRS